MAIELLRDDLLSLPGVDHAELDGEPVAPAGVRVRLAQGVDASAVADEVRRVLFQHGLRPEISTARDTPPSATETGEVSIEEPHTGGEDVPIVVETACNNLVSVGITEGNDGVVATATGSAREVSVRAAGPSVPAIEQAIVLAVAELAGTAIGPLVCSVDERDLGGTPVVTVMIQESGERLVGSAVVRSGRAYAVGRAAWAALSSR